MSNLIEEYLLKKPKLRKIVSFKSLFIDIENSIRLYRYIAFPYIFKDKKVVWTNDTLIFDTKDEFNKFCNTLNIKKIRRFGD